MRERDIFTAALEMTDPAARAVYLDQACAGDAALRRRVEMLLGIHGGSSGLWVSVGGTASMEDCDVRGNHQTALWVNTEEELCRRGGYETLTTLTVTNSRVTHNKGPALTMKEQAHAVVTVRGVRLSGCYNA